MIAPLPPQPGLPPVDSASAKPDPKGEGDLFAEILAAAVATAPAPRLPGPPPPMEHGPAVVAVAGLIAPGPTEIPSVGLTDPAAEFATTDRPDRPLPTARVFNQDGFFGASIGAAAGPELRPEPAPAVQRAAVGTDPERGIRQAGRPLAVEQLPEPTESVSAAPVSPMRPGAAPGAGAQRTAPAQPRLLAGPSLRAPVPETDAEPEPLAPLARRFALREPPPRAAVQVAMRELEQGIHVAARAEGLEAAERVRLHDEIAALLARHGLSARSIRISAPARGARAEEKLK